MTAHVVRRKPWGKGKRGALKGKVRVEFINEEEDGEAGEEGVLQ